ncbi:MAG: thiamine pyrophosphate-binding protein, partial [Raoultibacter sp.]
MPKSEVSADAALFLSVFFDELVRYGVREVVVSPGSRSTPLAMVAFEASRRADLGLRLFIDVDERGAAFFALGMAKASGRPVCLICTSGTAAANYYPAVLEAEASRVPLVVLTGDRPPRLQGLGAPQTCDQLKLYGDHARFFQQMPLPTSDPAALAFARQVARQALISACGPSTCEPAAGSAAYAAAGACGTGSPAHINFPFDDPLKPDLSIPELFTPGRSQV